MDEDVIEKALEGVRDAGIAIDGQSRIVRFNTNAENMLDWPGDDLVGRPLRSIMPAEFRERFQRAFERWVSRGETTLKDSRFRAPILTRDGKRIDVDIEVRRFRGPDGQRYVVGMFRPVARHEHPEEVLAVEKRLVEEDFQLV